MNKKLLRQTDGSVLLKQFFIVGEYMHEVFRQGCEGRMKEPIVPEDQ